MYSHMEASKCANSTVLGCSLCDGQEGGHHSTSLNKGGVLGFFLFHKNISLANLTCVCLDVTCWQFGLSWCLQTDCKCLLSQMIYDFSSTASLVVQI